MAKKRFVDIALIDDFVTSTGFASDMTRKLTVITGIASIITISTISLTMLTGISTAVSTVLFAGFLLFAVHILPKKIPKSSKFVEKIIKDVKSWWERVKQSRIMKFLSKIINKIKKLFRKITDFFKDIYKKVTSSIKKTIKKFSDNLTSRYNALVKWYNNLSTVKKFSEWSSKLGKGWRTIESKFNARVNSIVKSIESTRMYNALKNTSVKLNAKVAEKLLKSKEFKNSVESKFNKFVKNAKKAYKDPKNIRAVSSGAMKALYFVAIYLTVKETSRKIGDIRRGESDSTITGEITGAVTEFVVVGAVAGAISSALMGAGIIGSIAGAASVGAALVAIAPIVIVAAASYLVINWLMKKLTGKGLGEYVSSLISSVPFLKKVDEKFLKPLLDIADELLAKVSVLFEKLSKPPITEDELKNLNDIGAYTAGQQQTTPLITGAKSLIAKIKEKWKNYWSMLEKGSELAKDDEINSMYNSRFSKNLYKLLTANLFIVSITPKDTNGMDLSSVQTTTQPKERKGDVYTADNTRTWPMWNKKMLMCVALGNSSKNHEDVIKNKIKFYNDKSNQLDSQISKLKKKIRAEREKRMSIGV